MGDKWWESEQSLKGKEGGKNEGRGFAQGADTIFLTFTDILALKRGFTA